MLKDIFECLFVGAVAGIVAALVMSLCTQLLRSRRRGLPPGPLGLPFIGYLPLMVRDGHLEVEELRKKYGNVFGLQFGCRYVVFLCDFDSVKAALTHDALLHRPEEFPFNVDKDAPSLIVMNGPVWKEHRRFSMRMFKKLGTGTYPMETRIHDEVSLLLRQLESLKGQAVVPATVITPSTTNFMAALMFGRRFEHRKVSFHTTFDDILYMVDRVPALSSQLTLENFFPWLRKLMCFLGLGISGKLEKVFAHRDRFTESVIEDHEKTYQGDTVRDFTDGHIKELTERADKDVFTRKFLIGDVATLFVGGSGTTRTVLEWLLLMAATKPSMQARIRDEIDAVLGTKGGSSRITWSDRTRMPYTMAFMWETMRSKPLSPLSLMRCATEDVKICDYTIPRGSIVISSLWSIFHDASFWGDPDVFRPERFLVGGGTSAKKPQRLIPFSYGKRSCPAEYVGTMVLFVYFTTILQHFFVEMPSDDPEYDFNASFGLSLRPGARALIFRPRKCN